MFRNAFGQRSPRSTFRPARQFCRLRLENLESRLAPAVDIWTGGNNAIDLNWSDSKNWSLNAVPGASDTAEFTSGNLVKDANSVVDTNFSIGALLIDGSWGSTLSVNAALTLSGTSEWDSGTISLAQLSGTLSNNGSLTLKGSGNVVLTGGGTFTNHGIIFQTNSGNLDLGGASNVATTLSNAVNGTYNFQADSGISFGGGAGGGVVNAGIIEKSAGTGNSAVNQPLTNNGGTLDAESGTLVISDGSNNSGGTYKTASGAILDLTGGSTFAEKGVFTASGAGEISLNSGNLNIGTAGATFTIPSTVSFQWSGGTINVPVNATLTYNGALALTASSNMVLNGGGTFLENGVITQSGTGNLGLGGSSSVAGTLKIPKGSTYVFSNDSGISFGGGAGGTVVNLGTIQKSAGSGTSAINEPLTNTGGTIDAESGGIVLEDSATDAGGTFKAGPVTAALNLTGGGTLTETGTLTTAGAGVVTLGGGTLSASAVTTALIVPAALTFQWSGGAVNVPVNDTMTVTGNLTFTGSANELLEGGGTLVEKGTIHQAGTGHLAIVGTGAVATTLSIPVGSVYNFQNDSGIVFGGGTGGVVNNAGTIEKTGGVATSAISGVAFNNNNGTLNVTTGTLSMQTNGGVNTGGTFTVATGAILDLSGGGNSYYTGTFTGSGGGQIQLNSGTVHVVGGTNGATFNFPSGLFRWNGGTIDTNNSTLTVKNALSLTSTAGVTLTGGGTLSLSGTLIHSGIGTLEISSTVIDIASTGIYDLTADAKLSGSGEIINSGLLEKTGKTGGSLIDSGIILDNSNRLEVHSGTLTVSGPVTQISGGVLTAGSWSVFGSANVVASLSIPNASFATIGLGASVTLSGVNSSFTNLSAVILNQGSFSLLGGQSYMTGGSFTNSGSLTLSPGSALTANGNLTDTSSGKVTIQISATSGLTGKLACTPSGKVSLGGSLIVTLTGTPAIGASFEILNNEGASAITGIFAGLPEGSTIMINGMTFKISYKGGTGNDVTLTRTV
jgi:hypothetical protein